MSSRQLHSKGASDGQSLPDRTRKGKKSSDQQTMDQQSSPQPEQHTRPGVFIPFGTVTSGGKKLGVVSKS